MPFFRNPFRRPKHRLPRWAHTNAAWMSRQPDGTAFVETMLNNPGPAAASPGASCWAR